MKKIQIILALMLSISCGAIASEAKAQSDTELKVSDPSSLIPSLLNSAEKGDMQSQYTLGTIYKQGLGVEVNDFKAFFWLKKSAWQGLAKAQNNLA